ncbi:alpha-E domain-containing protein [Crateriforma spongiae]|uniref:alpha-E domain-containing protein n=1 Tax=Crateriforma spongiae TaxID=2724528 RepID=UPI0014456EC2|nr:alpha-E domain-containing protein [Crateriforma spongiae]
MLARVAESIYWMSRQMERAENLSRFLEVTLNFILDQPENLVDPWEPLIQVTGDTQWYSEHYSRFDRPSVIHFLAFDDRYPNSMLSSLRYARENARGVRETLSSETFEQINDFYHFVNDAALQKVEPTADFFDQVRQQALLWNGILDGTMSHDIGWHFANFGRLIERADKTSRILDVKYFNLLPRVDDVGTAVDDIQWSALLLAISGFEAYRREHHLIDIEKVVDFFIFNRRFPRSILSCVAGADWSLSQIEDACSSAQPRSAKQASLGLRHRLANTNVKEVLAGGMHQFIDTLQVELNDIGEALNQDYFQVTLNA